MTVDGAVRPHGQRALPPGPVAVSRRRFVRSFALGMIAAPVAGWATACAPTRHGDRQQAAAPTQPAAIPPTLDGERELDPRAVADLARERVLLGAHWLAGVSQPDGAFAYRYHPITDRYDTRSYDEVRHAGVTWSLYEVVRAFGDDSAHTAAEAATRYIAAATQPVPSLPGRGYLRNGTVSLGGHALAVVALAERRAVTGDVTRDGLLHEAADFLLALELPDQPGRYAQHVDVATGARSAAAASGFYPGEALLALTRLAQEFPGGPYLDAAARAADYLIHHRDGDLDAPGRAAPIDHWLTIALSRLVPLHHDPAYVRVAYRLADAVLADQYTAGDGSPERIGAARGTRRISYTSTATRGEALVAVWRLAAALGDRDAVRRYSTGALRTAQFQLRVQFADTNTKMYPHPERVGGGWGANATDPVIRIDYVQHNISALTGLYALVSNR